ncbi:PREDICTED: uncharacterized protein LOC106816834 [Priapulus caudatus]|uniref:Uncharacterized protein LOC106816834 n=1 Tax=Priapulus caudatus TaxID=37621 RepID=A0ABM1EXN3_PRICU|nr:PREDICTED: uncharacterized protein LOC106816834 [Priapulus caudatus]
MWSVSAALAIVQVVVLNNWAFYPGRAMCFMDWQTREAPKLAFNIADLVLCVLLLLGLLLIVVILVVRAARRHHTNSLRLTASYGTDGQAADNRRVIRNNLNVPKSDSPTIVHRGGSRLSLPLACATSKISAARCRSAPNNFEVTVTKKAKTISLHQLKAARILLTVVTCFVVCYLPLFALNVATGVLQWRTLPPRLDRVAPMLLYTSRVRRLPSPAPVRAE